VTQTELVQLPDNSVSQAQAVRAEVNGILEQIRAHEDGLRTSFTKLGIALLKIRENKLWLSFEDADGKPFRSFGAYIDSVKEYVNKGRTQVYATLSIAERLLPYVPEEKLIEIGITKAGLLSGAVKETGKAPSSNLLAKAADPAVSVSELQAAVFEELNPGRPEGGKYFDFGGCYFTAEEKTEFETARQIALRVDPPVPQEWPEHFQTKEVMLRFAREFRATYEAEVNGETGLG
jgi:hypothetical protein